MLHQLIHALRDQTITYFLTRSIPTWIAHIANDFAFSMLADFAVFTTWFSTNPADVELVFLGGFGTIALAKPQFILTKNDIHVRACLRTHEFLRA